jgi:thiol-disulfide isomerase/thioredoxin
MRRLYRLAAGATLVAALFGALWFFVLDRNDDETISPALLLPASVVDGGAAEVGLGDGELAPDFEVSRPDGTRLRLSDLRGRPVVINFWATWCGSCLTEMPELKALQQERGLNTFTVLAINAGETLPEAQRFIDFLDAPFLYGLDVGLVLSDAYGVYGLPLSVFIDSEGIVRAVHRGHADRVQLETLTGAAIDARPAGELPFALRMISTVPRERVLVVTSSGDGRATFSSRSLRCDPSYCARAAVDALANRNAIRETKLEAKSGEEPTLTVRYDASALSRDQVVGAVVEALSALEDPVYTTPIEVRYKAAS